MIHHTYFHHVQHINSLNDHFIYGELVEVEGRHMNSKLWPRVTHFERSNPSDNELHTVHPAVLTKKQAGLIAECYAIARADAERESSDPWNYVCSAAQESGYDK